jgi:lipopolysaccharide/colanic/teichoic acid biosynthesis glycosyltransferase
MSRSRGTGHLSFKLVPSHLDVIIGKAGIDQVTDIPLLEIENRLAKFGPRLTKRLFDLTLAGFFLLFSAPVFLLAYLFRPGFHSRMVSSPDGRSLRLWQLVRGGRLAKWPWLLAILAGKLSWVGLEIPNEEGEGEKGGTGEVEKSRSLSPPPAFPLSVSEPIVPCSLQLPLGVTGLAQINRRAPLSAEEKNKLYLYYVTHYSPMLDMEILFRKLFRI